MPGFVFFVCLFFAIRNEYSADGDISDLDSDFLSERYRELPRRLRKSVRFEEVLDDSAPGRMGSMRRKLKREDRKARMKADVSREWLRVTC